MGLLDELKRKENWCAFFEHKKEKGHIYKKYEKALGDFIEEEKYLEKVEKITEGSFVFSPPEKVYISKNENKEKRCVYIFEEEEGYILKCLCHLMYKYDYLMNENCYSFRKNKSAHTAVKKIKAIKYKDEKYCVKLDIHNYFNSIPQEELARVIEEEIKDDIALRDFLTRFVKDKRVKVGEEIVYEDKGAMAGCPLSSFFANIYLKSLDEYFSKNVKYYFRYSDDILFFADTLEEARHLTEVLKSEIEKRGLEVNGKKTLIYPPHSGFEFLGFFIKGECVDIAPHAKQKLKNKMRRKARALYRWRSNVIKLRI
ncbi:MAG: group II intron reverse transcriptase domain-containing protein [Firmicutes bacterium]|nr:group II intron reverse transcriptase domain-containing protein [Bacillota bacterium]